MSMWLNILFFLKKTHGTLIKLSSSASCERYKLKEYQIKKYFLWTRTQKCCTWFIYNLNHVKSLIISMSFNMMQIPLSTFPHVKRSVLSRHNLMEIHMGWKRGTFQLSRRKVATVNNYLLQILHMSPQPERQGGEMGLGFYLFGR